MLVVSDLLSVAQGLRPARQLGAASPLRFAPSKRSPVVVWNVCRHCNMTCPHCYAAAGARPSLNDLSHDEAIRMLDGLVAGGVRILIFSGGEPLLREDLLELIAHGSRQGLSCHLSTNGVLIDRNVAERLRDVGVAYVGVSVDGLPAFNDAYRGLVGGYERALDGLRHARDAGLRTGLRMTVTRRNVDMVDSLISTCSDQGIDRFYLSHLVYAGRGRRMAGEDLTPPECRAVLESLFERADALLRRGGLDAGPKIVTGGNDSDGVLLLGWVRERYGDAAATSIQELLTLRGGNSAGEGVLNVDNQGRVHPDQFWNDVTLGDLRVQALAEVLRHPLLAQLRQRTVHLTGRCGECRHLALCRGSHRERAIAAHGDMWGPDPSCVMTDAEIAPTAERVGATV